MGVFWLYMFTMCMSIRLETHACLHVQMSKFSGKDCLIEVPVTTGSSKQLF